MLENNKTSFSKEKGWLSNRLSLKGIFGENYFSPEIRSFEKNWANVLLWYDSRPGGWHCLTQRRHLFSTSIKFWPFLSNIVLFNWSKLSIFSPSLCLLPFLRQKKRRSKSRKNNLPQTGAQMDRQHCKNFWSENLPKYNRTDWSCQIPASIQLFTWFNWI